MKKRKKHECLELPVRNGMVGTLFAVCHIRKRYMTYYSDDDFRNYYNELNIYHACFKELRTILNEDYPIEERVSQKVIFEKRLEDMVDKFDGFDELKKTLTYIKNGLGCWYTCMLYPGMEPTNNLGEQAIREHVILRKIIGCFRSENGAENYQYIASLLADWRLQGKNGFEELELLLRQELCMS